MLKFFRILLRQIVSKHEDTKNINVPAAAVTVLSFVETTFIEVLQKSHIVGLSEERVVVCCTLPVVGSSHFYLFEKKADERWVCMDNN